jgi:large subunit ribosomal protein L10
MAISRDKKQTLVTKLTELFASAKGIASATYAGLSVADLQSLRADGRAAGVVIKVSKNRLVRVALAENDKFKSADTTGLTGQLIYAFSNEDEATPAQVLAKFARKHPALKLANGFDNNGNALNAATVTALADQLRGQLVSVIAGPLSGFLRVANGNQSGFVRVLSEHAKAL